MTRRDTILMAVLINTGLLVILFTTAITTPSPNSQQTVASRPVEPGTCDVAAVGIPVTEQDLTPRVHSSVKPTEDLDVVVTRYAAVNEPRLIASETSPPSQVIPLVAPVSVQGQSKPAVNGMDFTRYLEVTVKRGDTLEKIARANGTTVSALMESNSLSSTRLQIGDVLKLPAPPTQNLSLPVAEPVNSGEYYTIRSGDNPWVVAMKFHVPLNELLKLNDLDEDAARKLKPGDKIRIR